MIKSGDDMIHAEILFDNQIIEDTSHEKFEALLLYIVQQLKLKKPIKDIKKYILNSDINETEKETLQKLINQQASNITGKETEIPLGKIALTGITAYTVYELLKIRKSSTQSRAIRFLAHAQEELKKGNDLTDKIRREVNNFKADLESSHRTIAKAGREIAYHEVDNQLSKNIRGWISVAVLDNRTSAQCLALHNEFYSIKDYPTRADVPNPPPRHPNCYDKETLVMTEDGFKYFKDVSVGERCLSFNTDTGEMEYAKVVKTFKKYEKSINRIKSKTVDMAVSEDHPFIGYKREWKDRKKYKFVKYESISEIPKSEFKLYVGAENPHTEKEYIRINGVRFKTSAFAKFIAIYLSDGHYSKSSKAVVISRKRDQDKIKKILEELGIEVRAYKEKLSILSHALNEYVRKLGNSSDTKIMPKEVLGLGRKHAKDFIGAYLISDGHISKEKTFDGYKCTPSKTLFTTSSKLRDGIIIVAMNAGYSCKVTTMKPKDSTKKDGSVIHSRHEVYRISINSGKYRSFGYCNVEKIEYNDYVYDVELDKNHTLLTMRNGNIVWGSNCRSMLMTVWEGTRITDYKGQKVETFLKQNPKQAEGIMGKKKYRMWKTGKAKIDKYIDLKGKRFFTNEEIIKRLGIKSEVRLRKINEGR